MRFLQTMYTQIGWHRNKPGSVLYQTGTGYIHEPRTVGNFD